MRHTALLLSLLLGSVAFALRAVAAPTGPQPLDPGLTYLRVAALGETIAEVSRLAGTTDALVLDLRYADATDTDATALGALLAGRRSASARWFVLVSPATPPALAAALQSAPPGVLTLGVAGSTPPPAVVVAQPADVDRRAYDAWSEQLPLAALIAGKVEKERYDEASLVREFARGVSDPAPPPAPDPTNAPAATKAPVLTDRVLQRAVHLHRALQALRPRAR